MSLTDARDRAVDSGLNPSNARRWGRLGLLARAAQVRLRFVVVLVLAFLVVGRWDSLMNRWESFTRSALGRDSADLAVSSDTEYFCPMDPGVRSDWPGKCGICNMGLVRRKVGEAVALPSGVVARMQFSPYRLQLAGVQTSAVGYQALIHEERLEGVLEGTNAGNEWIFVAERGIAALEKGQSVELFKEGQGGMSAMIQSVGRPDEEMLGGRVVLKVIEPGRVVRRGTRASLQLRKPVAAMEPFCSLPADPPAIRKGEPRAIFLCLEHADVLGVRKGRCPIDGKVELEPQLLLANQRVGWWCPMHPKVASDKPGGVCKACGGMALAARVLTYRPAGQVLAVPESAVVDTGTRKVVYVERMAGMFDGVEVKVGARCGDFYPVAEGLEPGQRVATAGAFLIDAETRLNPSLASAYFGAGRGARTAEPQVRTEVPMAIRAMAESQKICPVTGKPLGSMGAPIKVMVEGRAVLICCEGCEGPLVKSPEKYLAKLKAGGEASSPTSRRP